MPSAKTIPDDFKSQQLSLHAKIGGKHTTYLNVTDDVISSPEEFAARWFKGLINHIKTVDAGKEASRAAYKFQHQLTSDPELLEYVTLFLKRTYWRNCDAWQKKRPKKEEAALWIGQTNASYGLLITPRFKNGEWENDVSEIRHFKPNYWTIGHVLETGLVVPHSPQRIEFFTIEQYLVFFQNIMVRQTRSPYEMEIAKKYCELVLSSKQPYEIPLLIQNCDMAVFRHSTGIGWISRLLIPIHCRNRDLNFLPGQHMGTYPGQRKKIKKKSI